MNRWLLLQVCILALCVWAVAELAINFPYPSPLIRPLLPPKERWPTKQIEGWVEAEDFPSSFLEYFGRDPKRTVPAGASWVAPADGVVGNELYRDGNSYFVVNMSFWDVHVIRAPTAGVVTGLAEEGLGLVRNPMTPEQKAAIIYEKGKAAPVQKIITIETKSGILKVRMITSYWASRLKVWVRPGQKVKKGQRIGRIVLGSTTVLEVPGDMKFLAKPGAHVKGGESIIYNPGAAK